METLYGGKSYAARDRIEEEEKKYVSEIEGLRVHLCWSVSKFATSRSQSLLHPSQHSDAVQCLDLNQLRSLDKELRHESCCWLPLFKSHHNII